MFPSTTYRDRRQALASHVKRGLVLFLGNEYSPMNYAGNPYRFRQDSNFLYFFGLDQAGLAGVLDVESGESTLFGDDVSVDHIVWMGPQPSMRSLADRVGAAQLRGRAALADVLAEAQAAGRLIHFPPPYRHLTQLRLAEYLQRDVTTVLDTASTELIQAIVRLRAYKSEEEIVEMEKALATTAEMHRIAMRMATPGLTEAQLVGAVHGVARSAGGDLAYQAILTVNGQTLHNHHHHNTLRSGQLILGDYGAESTGGYAGDITRTFPVDRQFTAQQKEIYQIVLDAEMAVIEALRPGVPYRDLHLLAGRVIVAGLSALGLMKGDVDAAVAAGAQALFFPHGLGHMIGLDVHDMEDLGEDWVGYDGEIQRSEQFGLRSLRLGRRLETGFVLTVEPGIYFIPELIDQWRAKGHCAEFVHYEALEAYRNFGGIRIEDDCLITDRGYRVLGPAIPKTIAEVEAVRNAVDH
ncbi:MAG: aminopeptidase P family protein [Bacteroidota bacterium]